MSDTVRDRLTAVILLAVSAVWIAGVFLLVPAVEGAPTSPRSFPLAMGIALAGLSLLLLTGRCGGSQDSAGQPRPAEAPWIELRSLASTFGVLAVYIVLLSQVGFLLATAVTVAGFLWFVLGKRTPAMLIGLPVGLAFGIWLLLGKLMGVHLPQGAVINLF